MTDSGLFDLIDGLESIRPLRPESVGPLTGLHFERDDAASNAAKVVLRGTPAGKSLFASGTLHYPTSDAWGRAGFLRATLRDDITVTQAELTERLGRESKIDMPTPREPPGSAFALQYFRPWARISFTFPPDEDRILDVLINEAEPG